MASKLISSRIKKYTSLVELEAAGDKGSVFALNATTGEMEGQILINVPKKNGTGTNIVKIPKTFNPIDLTTQVNRSQLLESSEFRKTVTNGLLKLISVEYAQLLLASPEGKEEARRLLNEAETVRVALQNAGVTERKEIEIEPDEDDEYVDVADVSKEVKRVKNTKSSKSKSSISLKLQALVQKVQNESMSQTQIVAALKNYNQGVFKLDELRFLAGRYKNMPKVMKFLKEVLAVLKNKKEELEA